MGFSKSNSSTKPNAYAEPYITAAGKAQGPAFEAQQGQVAQTLPSLEAGTGYFQDVLAGNHLKGNPYAEDIARQTGDDTQQRVNQQFMGRWGSGYQTKILTRELADARNRVMFDDYNRERAYQDQAPKGLLDIAMGRVALPGIPASTYAQNNAGLFGQYNKTKTSTPWGPALIQGAQNASQAAFMASDRRLKMDIRQIGQEADGLGVYEYRYVTDQPGDPLRTGVMADEVAEHRPWALGPDRNGFATVNYEAL